MFHREALELFPAPHPRRPALLNSIAMAISTRFNQSGKRNDLDDAISFSREALELQATTPADRLENLAVVLSKKFNQSGDSKGLDEPYR